MIDWSRIESAKAVIFDCDGTLVDSMPVHYLAWHRTMTDVGIRFEEDRFYALGGMPSDRIIALLSREQNVNVDPVSTANRKEQAFLELIHLLEPIEQVVNVARTLRGNKPIAVATGGCRDIVSRQLASCPPARGQRPGRRGRQAAPGRPGHRGPAAFPSRSDSIPAPRQRSGRRGWGTGRRDALPVSARRYRGRPGWRAIGAHVPPAVP